MSKTKANETAFPEMVTELPNGGVLKSPSGLTKREYFAALAMQGLMRFTQNGPGFPGLAWDAAKMADALIEELNRE